MKSPEVEVRTFAFSSEPSLPEADAPGPFERSLAVLLSDGWKLLFGAPVRYQSVVYLVTMWREVQS